MYFLPESMRQYKRKTQRGLTTKNVMQKVMTEVLIDKKFCRTVANKYDIPHVTLRRYCLNYRKEAAIVKGDDITQWFPKWALPPPRGRWRDLGGR